ncbi:antibiotic biosynthesis monooxygenase [Phormidium sp. FACHB-592]|uniref:Antibiotic biosynthesis monooxygenase n=1 Tax=Stenomitos frigidus AS-A4 TaxID=2933935 RepID=A0ABV0KRY2_9CYAN|nr:antibiotic biosynthesis monooxygenase family protein [Phormidium sp. FACHB-592]MBD2074598.1 antibiotic biosynthesis monooxygenase [Phormidium sp. FACHB-592]
MTAPVVLINVFSVPPHQEAAFINLWTEALERSKNEPGFIDAKLHKSLDPNARFEFINIAHWESEAAWQTAFDKLPGAALTQQVPYEQNLALYQVVVQS